MLYVILYIVYIYSRWIYNVTFTAKGQVTCGGWRDQCRCKYDDLAVFRQWMMRMVYILVGLAYCGSVTRCYMTTGLLCVVIHTNHDLQARTKSLVEKTQNTRKLYSRNNTNQKTLYIFVYFARSSVGEEVLLFWYVSVYSGWGLWLWVEPPPANPPQIHVYIVGEVKKVRSAK